MKTFAQILALSPPDIQKELEKTMRTMLEVRMGLVTGHEKNTAKAKKQRRYLAQLKTAYRQKEIGLSPKS